MVAGEKLGDPTGGLGTAITGTALYSNLKSRLTKKLATKAGRQLIAKKLGSIGAKRLAQSIGAGTASTLWTGPGAAAGAVIGGIVGTTWALYDAWDLFFGEEEEEEYTFGNNSNSFYAQLSYRPTMAESDFMKKLEFVGRYSNFNAPEGAEWEEQSEQYAFGLNYWLTWRSVIKIAYQTTDSVGGHDGGGITNGFYIHWAIGF